MSQKSTPIPINKPSKKITKIPIIKPKLEKVHTRSIKKTNAGTSKTMESNSASGLPLEAQPKVTERQTRRSSKIVASNPHTPQIQLPTEYLNNSPQLQNCSLESFFEGRDYQRNPNYSPKNTRTMNTRFSTNRISEYNPSDPNSLQNTSNAGANNNNLFPPQQDSGFSIPSMMLEETFPSMMNLPNISVGREPRLNNTQTHDSVNNIIRNFSNLGPSNTVNPPNVLNGYSSSRIQISSNGSFPQSLINNNASTNVNVVPQRIPTSFNIEQPRAPTINAPAGGPFNIRQSVGTGTGNNVNYLWISGSQTDMDIDIGMTQILAPGGLIQRQLQHFQTTMNGLSRIINNMNRSMLTPMNFMEDLEDFPHLRREGFFDEAFFEVIMSHRQAPGQRGLSREELDSLENTVYHEPRIAGKNKANDESENKKNCVICLNDFQSGEHISKLPCHHNFHKDCIENWLTQKACCPICRRNLV